METRAKRSNAFHHVTAFPPTPRSGPAAGRICFGKSGHVGRITSRLANSHPIPSKSKVPSQGFPSDVWPPQSYHALALEPIRGYHIVAKVNRTTLVEEAGMKRNKNGDGGGRRNSEGPGRYPWSKTERFAKGFTRSKRKHWVENRMMDVREIQRKFSSWHLSRTLGGKKVEVGMKDKQ